MRSPQCVFGDLITRNILESQGRAGYDSERCDNHRVSYSFCFEEHSDATGERQSKRLFTSFSLSYWRRDLCAEREFSVTLMGPVRDVLPRVRHRQHCNYLLARWIWETGKCFAKLNPEFNLGEAQKLCCGFHTFFSNLYLMSSWALTLEALNTWNFLFLSLLFQKLPESLTLWDNTTFRQNTINIKWPCRFHGPLGTSCSAALVLPESLSSLVHPGFGIFLEYIVAVVTSRCHFKWVSKGLSWPLEMRITMLLLLEGLCCWTVSCLFTGCLGGIVEVKKHHLLEGNGCTDFFCCLFVLQYPKYGQHFKKGSAKKLYLSSVTRVIYPGSTPIN